MTRWDARWKLAAILLAIAFACGLQGPWAAGLAFAFAIIVAVFTRLLSKQFLSRLGLIAFSLMPFLIVLPFSEGGTLLALAIMLRALAIGTFAFVLVASEPFERTLAAAHSLGVPEGFTQIARLAHRYSATLFDEFRRLRIAWLTRGFRTTTSRRSYRTISHGLGAVLVRSADRGERVSAAMRARGFDGRLHLATPFHACVKDAILCVIVVAPMLGLLLWDRLA